jgi:hypothetical protein
VQNNQLKRQSTSGVVFVFYTWRRNHQLFIGIGHISKHKKAENKKKHGETGGISLCP